MIVLTRQRRVGGFFDGTGPLGAGPSGFQSAVQGITTWATARESRRAIQAGGDPSAIAAMQPGGGFRGGFFTGGASGGAAMLGIAALAFILLVRR
jgi:hypothetical protein